MPAVCFYFQVHQPYRVRPYDVFQVGKEHEYFDDALNRETIQKVARKCYIPANEAMLALIERHQGKFRVCYSLTGVVVEQLQRYAPEALESFQKLVATGAVELCSETYYHSLSSLYDPVEFREQVALHQKLMQSTFHVTPTVFRNTELILTTEIAAEVERLGFRGILGEGADNLLDWRSPNFVYRVANTGLPVLLRNYRLSDDIAFRFSTHGWADFPLTAEKFARWVHELSGTGDVVNLFMDYETFGEHQWSETGIFEFLDRMPEAVLAHPAWEFATPSEVFEKMAPVANIPIPQVVSWADLERDLSAWRGNEMQGSAIDRVYALGERIRRRNNPTLLSMWRKLTSSDHFYYMSTKALGDGAVHDYFNPFDSPYEAFINYMNAVSDIEESVLQISQPAPLPVRAALA